MREPQLVRTPSVQKMSLCTIREQTVGARRSRQRSRGRDRDHGVQLRLRRLEPAQQVASKLDARELALREPGGEPGQAAGMQRSAHSITLGTI